MPDPLRKTFDFLTRSGNPEAGPLLMRSLRVIHPRVRHHAVDAILRRGERAGHYQLLRHYSAFADDVRQQLHDAKSTLLGAVRDALKSRDQVLRQATLEYVRGAESFSHFDSLLSLLLEGGASSATALDVVRHLIGRLEELSLDEEAARDHRRTINRVVVQMDEWLPMFRTNPRLPELLDAILILGSVEHGIVRKLLTEAEPDLRQAAWERLEQSTHRGLVRLLLAMLDRGVLSYQAIEILQSREEPEFIDSLLEVLPQDAAKLRSLGKVSRFSWLNPAAPAIEEIPAERQAALVRLVRHCGMTEDDKFAFYQSMLHRGGPDGRLAASEILSQADAELVESAVYDALKSEDTSIQAWATSKLRDRPTPEAFAKLIDQLDHPSEQVREVAREELSGLDAPLLLELVDDLPPETCRRLGALVQKIDPGRIDELKASFTNPVRSRRITAVRAVRALGLHGQVETELFRLLYDDDYVVRRTAIDVLRDSPSHRADRELKLLLLDEDSRIREIAQRVLDDRSNTPSEASQPASNS